MLHFAVLIPTAIILFVQCFILCLAGTMHWCWASTHRHSLWCLKHAVCMRYLCMQYEVLHKLALDSLPTPQTYPLPRAPPGGWCDQRNCRLNTLTSSIPLATYVVYLARLKPYHMQLTWSQLSTGKMFLCSSVESSWQLWTKRKTKSTSHAGHLSPLAVLSHLCFS